MDFFANDVERLRDLVLRQADQLEQILGSGVEAEGHDYRVMQIAFSDIENGHALVAESRKLLGEK